jgi:hypothetical protein
MLETAAQLSDPVFPRLPVRQWVFYVRKRLRYFMQRDWEGCDAQTDEGCTLSQQTWIWRRKRHPTLRLISA